MMTRRPSSGFSLLEVLLALALSSAVFVGIGLVSSWQTQLSFSRHQQVLEAHVARVTLDRIARDLRNVIVDTDAMENAFQVSLGGDEGSAVGSAGEGTEGTSQGATGGETGATNNGETLVTDVPGIYGTRNQIQIDTQHIPTWTDLELEQQDGTMGMLGPTTTDKTSVVYVVGIANANDDVPRAMTSDDVGPAFPQLLEARIPRSQAVWQYEMGGSQSVAHRAVPVAPEVRMLECWYYDGAQWLDSWDMEVMFDLPRAVHLLVWANADQEAIPPASLRDAVTDGASSTSNSVQRTHIYSLLVALPLGQEVDSTSSTGSDNVP